MSYFWSVLGLTLGYLAGSLSSATLVSSALGLPDPRAHGSGNPGATNVLRLGGKKAGALTLLGDALKGLLPVLLIGALSHNLTAQVLTALGAFLGHLYPCFYHFKGGKGVATACGVLLALQPLLALLLVAVWAAIFYKTRISSLSALGAMFAALPLAVLLGASRQELLLLLLLVGVLVVKHRDNIKRLREGKEQAFGRK